MTSPLRTIRNLLRRLNWSRRRWDSATDREFHEDRYRESNYEPFSWAYPGYMTILRFADLAEEALPNEGFVVDIGCGPAEITCELACRRPALRFFGIDHSSTAVARACVNAEKRGLSNVRFERMNVEEYVPNTAVDAVLLFDSFHHLTEPAGFVQRLSEVVKRWILVEPTGDWAGRWKKHLDFDWLAMDLDKIRARIAHLCQFEPESNAGTLITQEPTKPRGTAVEHRYTLDDFERFFPGFALNVRGTISGLDSLPPNPSASGELRQHFGKLRYELYRQIDDWLYEQRLDSYCKHWFIVAERNGTSRLPDFSRAVPADDFGAGIAGAWAVRYGEYHGLTEAGPGERFTATMELTNEGWHEWSSQGERPVFTSYHWLDKTGRITLFDGERTPLPGTIRPNESVAVAFSCRTPDIPGRHVLAIDLVCEGVTWFSEGGCAWREVPFVIRKGTHDE